MTFPRIEPGSHGWESYTSLKKKEQRVRKKRKRAKGEVAAEEQAVGASVDPGDQKSVRIACVVRAMQVCVSRYLGQAEVVTKRGVALKLNKEGSLDECPE